ncbi:hypothetical protein GDO86_013367 [Hymenochirus boettgeri]|uniref:F-box domain-containing protein n=1 Tax=Hymenochirus boettgeri TaxID=247094 RepID=A0A8T2IWE1_9PIPI|nr:hypothetical protein GDO86_013367 [Hymenochirus boettgeri]
MIKTDTGKSVVTRLRVSGRKLQQGPEMWPNLPEEILLVIFSYLDAQALGRLAQVCRKLRHFTGKDAVWRGFAKKGLNSGFSHQGTDTASGISIKERVRVSKNWKNGCCRRDTMLKWKRNLMPWICLDRDLLYLSQAEEIRAYRLHSNVKSLHRQPFAAFLGHREDVCRFVLASSHIISGGGDGRIAIHKAHSTFSIQFTAHDQDVNCVDCHRGIIVSGSRDQTAKVWSLSSSRVGQCLHTIQTDDRVWSVAINPMLSSFITGTACCGHSSPLRIWDLQSGQLITCLGTDFRRGAGVLDVCYETPYTLLSCGYDTYIRYWDSRTSTSHSLCHLPQAAQCTVFDSTPAFFMQLWLLHCMFLHLLRLILWYWPIRKTTIKYISHHN